jgi:hypothetical protein
MFKMITDAIINYALKHPWEHLHGYMNRYWVVPYSRWRWLLAARVHHILRSDHDDVFHDHPWSYLTIILRGGYWEVRPRWNDSGLYTGEERVWYGPGSVLFRRAKSWHRLEIPQGKTAWTLFITFRYQQKWGFLVAPENKVRYEEYLGLPIKSDAP